MTDIIFDCDDVLLNWIGGFRESLPIKPATPFPLDWDMDLWVGVPARPLVERFNASPAFGELEPCPGAVEAVAALKAAGHKLIVLTSCSRAVEVIGRRRVNLERVFGPVFSKVICLELGASKKWHLGRLDLGVWVEDNVNHAEAGLSVGHETYLFNRPHNIHLSVSEAITRIDSFDPILSRFA